VSIIGVDDGGTVDDIWVTWGQLMLVFTADKRLFA
jgi:hypothetical protein